MEANRGSLDYLRLMHGKPSGPLGLRGTIEFFLSFTESLFSSRQNTEKENIKERTIKRGVEVYVPDVLFVAAQRWRETH